MRRTLIRISVAVFCVCAIVFISNTVSAGIPDNAKSLAALDDEWSKAATAGDVEKVVSFYADDAVVYPPNAPIISDRAAIKDAWAKMLADPKANCRGVPPTPASTTTLDSPLGLTRLWDPTKRRWRKASISASGVKEDMESGKRSTICGTPTASNRRKGSREPKKDGGFLQP